MRNNKRFFGAVMIVGLMASGAYALTASNTFDVADEKAGSGTQTISGYAVSNVAYTVDAADNSKYSEVKFNLDAAAGTGQVRAYVSTVAAPTGGGVVCTGGESTPFLWTCGITDSISTATGLTVSATGSATS